MVIPFWDESSLYHNLYICNVQVWLINSEMFRSDFVNVLQRILLTGQIVLSVMCKQLQIPFSKVFNISKAVTHQ